MSRTIFIYENAFFLIFYKVALYVYIKFVAI